MSVKFAHASSICLSHLYALLSQIAIAGIPTRHRIGNAQLMSSYSILFWCLYSSCSPGRDLLTNSVFDVELFPDELLCGAHHRLLHKVSPQYPGGMRGWNYSHFTVGS